MNEPIKVTKRTHIVDNESSAYLVFRHFSWLFMLDATDYKQTNVAHFMIAFGKETVFHAKYLTETGVKEQGFWFIRQTGGRTIQLHWDDMIAKVVELIEESADMGLVLNKSELYQGFHNTFDPQSVLTLI